MHSSLAVTSEGLPLGLSAVKFWTRDKFKGTRAFAKKINPTLMPIESKESYCWLENIRQTTDLLPPSASLAVIINFVKTCVLRIFTRVQESLKI
jgi:hypothetical protein